MTDVNAIAGSFAIVTKMTSGCCGEITLPEGSEAIFNGDKLSGEAVKSGAIKWFPDEHLRFKNRTSRAIDRAFQEFGMDWGGVCLVPVTALDAMMVKVNDIIKRYFDDVDALESVYDVIVAEHAAKQIPAVQSLILSSKLPWSEFRKRFHCYIPRPSIFSPIGVDDEEAGKEVQSGLQDAALNDIVDKSTVLRNSILGKVKVDARSIDPLKRLVEKCRSYGIINSAFGELANEFDAFAAKLVPPLVGDKLNVLCNYVTLLSSADAVQAFIANRNSSNAIQSIDEILGLTDPVFAEEIILDPAVSLVPPTAQHSMQTVMPSVVVETASVVPAVEGAPVFINDDDWLSF